MRALRAAEVAANVDADLAKRIGKTWSVTHQPTGFGIVMQRICRGEPVVRPPEGPLNSPGAEDGFGSHEELLPKYYGEPILINITNGKMESTLTLLCFGSGVAARINAQYVAP